MREVRSLFFTHVGDDFVENRQTHLGILPEEKAKQALRVFTADLIEQLLQETRPLVEDLAQLSRNGTDGKIVVGVERIRKRTLLGLKDSVRRETRGKARLSPLPLELCTGWRRRNNE